MLSTLAPIAIRPAHPTPGAADAVLAELAARASSLAERLSGPYRPVASAAGAARARGRRERWAALVAEGDEARFARRLSWDGIDVDRLDALLGDVRLAEGAPLPAWARLVGEVSARAVASADGPLPDGAGVPFEPLLRPFVAIARERLLAALGPETRRHLSEPALADLEDHLLGELADLAARPFHVRFRSAQAVRGMRLPVGDARSAGHDAFVRRHLRDGLLGLVRGYPLLARLLATTVEQWAVNTAALVQRFADDRAALAEGLGVSGRIARVETGLSDRHAGGQTVSILTLDTGDRVVYKPRDLDPEAAFASVVGWVNAQTGTDLRAAPVLRRPGYGWMAFVTAAPCADEAAVRRYYERAGRLLGLVYVLRGADFHYGNLIACGEHPIPIDLECLMCPEEDAVAADDPSAPPEGGIAFVWKQSVLRTGLLPTAHLRALGDVIDDSGLGGEPAPWMRAVQAVWTDVGTDAIAPGIERSAPEPVASRPRLGATAVRPEAYADAVADGFEAMVRWAVAEREVLTAPGGPLAAFDALTTRYIIRPTRVYGRALLRMTHPSLLRDGVDRSVEIDALQRSAARQAEPPPYWPAVAAEHDALFALDVPFFHVQVDGRDLFGQGTVLAPEYLPVSGLDGGRGLLHHLTDASIAHQTALIRYAFASAARHRQIRPGPRPNHLPLPAPQDRRPDALLEAASTVAEDLGRLALPASDGLPTWLMVHRLPQAGTEVGPVDDGWYQGRLGVAAFLAAEGGARGAGPLAASAAASAGVAPVTDLGALGLGGALYGQALIGGLLDDASRLAEARRLADRISTEAIAQDDTFDVIRGSAGALLAVLALHRRAPDAALLDHAHALADHLVGSRTVHPASGLRAWTTLHADHRDVGFAHGASGIAHALLRYHEATGDAAALAAAREGLAYDCWAVLERPEAYFTTVPLAAPEPTRTLDWSWCRGPIGIGLAVAANRRHIATPEADAVLRLALGLGAREHLTDRDHPCCGNAGRVELLLTAADALGDPTLREQAAALWGRVLDRADERGAPRLSDRSDLLAPGLFQGLAGVGYTTLRVARDGQLPSFLLWD